MNLRKRDLWFASVTEGVTLKYLQMWQHVYEGTSLACLFQQCQGNGTELVCFFSVAIR